MKVPFRYTIIQLTSFLALNIPRTSQGGLYTPVARSIVRLLTFHLLRKVSQSIHSCVIYRLFCDTDHMEGAWNVGGW